MAATTYKKVLYGLYNDETELLKAIKTANKQHLDIMDVYTPFPVHGLDPLLGLEVCTMRVLSMAYSVQ
jgi:hypothetical protein